LKDEWRVKILRIKNSNIFEDWKSNDGNSQMKTLPIPTH
jgi:hypothetical protein